MSKTLASQLSSPEVQAVTKVSRKAPKAKPEPEVKPEPVAATYREALANVLLTVPKSAHNLVVGATDKIVASIKARAKNEFMLGGECRKVQNAISKESFSRWIYEVVQRVGLARTTIYRYMDENDILSSALTYEPAREAFIGVTGGRGLFSREDGVGKLQGHVVAAFKKHPMPTTGNYEDCLDWAHECKVAMEQAQPPNKRNLGEMLKQARNVFQRALEGGKGVQANHKMAVEHIVQLYRLIAAKSTVLSGQVMEGIEKVDAEFDAIANPVKTTTEQTRARAIA